MHTSEPNNSNPAIILAAHGSSKDQQINQPLFEIAEQIRIDNPEIQVTPAFLDGQPDVRTVIQDIESDDVIVIPFMASNGYYTRVVFPEAIKRRGKRIHFADAIGNCDELSGLVDQRLKDLLSDCQSESPVVVVVGHGTRKNRNSCLITIDLTKRLRQLNSGVEIKFGFIDQNPPLSHIAEQLPTDQDVIVIPFLMGFGPHMTHDVPTAFGMSPIADQVFEPGFEFPLTMQSSFSSRNFILDAPIGSYLKLADLCIEISNRARSNFQTEKVSL